MTHTGNHRKVTLRPIWFGIIINTVLLQNYKLNTWWGQSYSLLCSWMELVRMSFLSFQKCCVYFPSSTWDASLLCWITYLEKFGQKNPEKPHITAKRINKIWVTRSYTLLVFSKYRQWGVRITYVYTCVYWFIRIVSGVHRQQRNNIQPSGYTVHLQQFHLYWNSNWKTFPSTAIMNTQTQHCHLFFITK